MTPPLRNRRVAEYRVFALEDTAVQVTWRERPEGRITLSAGPVEVEVEGRGGPGAAVLEPLEPGRDYDLVVDGSTVRRFRTLEPPRGEELFRFATMNDIHIGERCFGLFRTMCDRSPLAYPERCLRAALVEASDWGAQLLVLKGDLTDHGDAKEWRRLATLLAASALPKLAIWGNHDVHKRAVDGRPFVRSAGVEVATEPAAHDFPGIRIVLAQTAVPGWRRGVVTSEQAEKLVALAAEAPGPVFVAMHHNTQRFRFRTYEPPGISGPQSRALLDGLADANPATVVASGHNHRHRRLARGPIVLAEVGSTKDYPGTWTGYAVHEHGIRQVVRRIAAPDCIEWTEGCRRAVGGFWGLWAPGKLDDRCWSHTWPTG